MRHSIFNRLLPAFSSSYAIPSLLYQTSTRFVLSETLSLLSTIDSTSNIHTDITVIHDQFILTLLTSNMSPTPTISSFLISFHTNRSLADPPLLISLSPKFSACLTLSLLLPIDIICSSIDSLE
ncbi:unnamed protein product [Rotaria sordida]|uniref:Uncharacterized protein n=2 Tax=Rotaria sordida TaxID=392033 RepID=A0A813RCG1_9BILA|nr:unnamed protein product [Rotaria sordida]